jgi:hypothetical protein
LKPEGHWPVITQTDLHICTEAPGLQRRMAQAHGLNQRVEACQRGYILHRAIHPALLIGKQPISQYTFGHPGDARGGVIGLDGGQHQEARAYSGNAVTFNLNVGVLDALEQSNHSVKLALCGLMVCFS